MCRSQGPCYGGSIWITSSAEDSTPGSHIRRGEGAVAGVFCIIFTTVAPEADNVRLRMAVEAGFDGVAIQAAHDLDRWLHGLRFHEPHVEREPRVLDHANHSHCDPVV